MFIIFFFLFIDLVQFVTQPGFINLTWGDGDEQGPSTSAPSRRVGCTPNSTPVRAGEHIISTCETIDHTLNSHDRPGSSVEPLRKRRNIGGSSPARSPETVLIYGKTVYFILYF